MKRFYKYLSQIGAIRQTIDEIDNYYSEGQYIPKKEMLKRIISFFSFENDQEEDLEKNEVKKENIVEKVVPFPKKLVHAKIRIYAPENYEDALVVADCLKSGQAVVLNLSRIEVYTATRILDFISGIIHAVDGSYKKVGDNVFVFTPSFIDIMPEYDGNTTAKNPMYENEEISKIKRDNPHYG